MRWVQRCVLMVLMAAAACSSKPLQMDAGSGGVGWIDPRGDGGVTPDVGPNPPDAGPDLLPDDGPPPFSGLRSFVVTATFQEDSGVATHAFTLILSGDLRVAIAGGAREGAQFKFGIDAGGTFHSTQPIRFALAFGCQSSVTYDAIAFALDANGGLTGTAQGTRVLIISDVGQVDRVTASLTGVPDTEPPRLSLSSSTDPLAGVVAWATEPLARGTNPFLTSAGGDSVPLLAPPSLDPFVWLFATRARMLRYDDEYSLAVDGMTDFAGNGAITGGVFTTGPHPPPAPEDGFESVTDATLGGGQILSGADAPVIAGARSLYVPPTAFSTSPRPRFEVRLPVAAGDTALRFSYRTVNPGDQSNVFYRIGSEGGSILEVTLAGDPVQMTPATINGTAVMLGPLTTHRVPLPDDLVETEIVFQRTVRPQGCALPLPPIPGIIIDDLRVE